MAKNPFPGMDPFLERHWGDVHARLILYASDQLNRQMRGPLRARVEERLVVEDPDRVTARPIRPDVRVYEPAGADGGGVAVLAAPAVEVEPDVVEVAESEPETTTYLTIIDPSTGGTLVTVIEFLSPSNKEPRGIKSADLYLAKREELRRGGVSLVEVDLLRDGERFLPEYDHRYGKLLRASYAACVHRGWGGIRYETYSFGLRERLTSIRIPLRRKDPDAVLDLQALVDLVYENGRYDDIDYGRPLYPPLSAEDAAWAKARVAAAADGTDPAGARSPADA
jgi:hypothetical protein